MTPLVTAERIHVAAAVLRNAAGEVLLARRPQDAHQGGLWEFPGGKLEPGEGVPEALERELGEELGIVPEDPRPLIRVTHDYPDRRVLLDVWEVERWQGEASGREGQALSWVAPERLPQLALPAADVAIVAAVRLPDLYLVTPEPGGDRQGFLAGLAASIDAGVRLVQLRAKLLDDDALLELGEAAAGIAHARGARLLVNAAPHLATRLASEARVDGVHLDSRRLMALGERPASEGMWLAASCHDARELAQAERVGVDFVVLGPVAPTPSHADVASLGWRRFETLVAQVNLPVYALGGMRREDVACARRRGGRGIAAIRGLWLNAPDTGACPRRSPTPPRPGARPSSR